jgi:hypothetical protein
VKLIVRIDDIKLVVVFNMAYLRDPKEGNEFSNIDTRGKVLKQIGRTTNFTDFGVKQPMAFLEFRSNDFEKWYNNKKAQRILMEQFSIIIGFDQEK